jgi:hypothetical protein
LWWGSPKNLFIVFKVLIPQLFPLWSTTFSKDISKALSINLSWNLLPLGGHFWNSWQIFFRRILAVVAKEPLYHQASQNLQCTIEIWPLMELSSAEEGKWDENAPKDHRPPSPPPRFAWRRVLRAKFTNNFKKVKTSPIRMGC